MIVKNTTAAILAKSNQPLVIEEIQLPDVLFPGQVLVEVYSSGLCGAQINEIDAIKGPDLFLPHLLGHEGFGRVLQVGPGVSTVKLGDQVVMHWRPGTGIQSIPPKYKWQGQTLNAGWVTTLNKHAVVSENRITCIPNEKFDKNFVPLLGCALTTSLGVLENDAQIRLRDSLLIFGAGGVGLLLVKLAKFFGVSRVAIVDIHADKLKKAQELGASDTFIFKNKAQTLNELQVMYTNNLPSVAIDTTGNPEAIEVCYEISSSKARVILVGVPKKGATVSLFTLPLHFGKLLKGSEGGQSIPEKDIILLLDLVSTGKLNFDDYPTNIFSLSKVNEAVSQLRKGTIGRMIIDFSLT